MHKFLILKFKRQYAKESFGQLFNPYKEQEPTLDFLRTWAGSVDFIIWSFYSICTQVCTQKFQFVLKCVHIE